MNSRDIKNFFNKILVFYNPNKAGYWNTITRCCIFEKPKELSRYYLDFSSKAEYPGRLTRDGIPLYSFFGQPEIEHPIVIAQFALGIFELLYRSGFKDPKLENKYIGLADWFIKNKVQTSGGIGWLVNYKITEYGMVNPWISALAQGEAISVLSRASLLTADNTYSDIAELALNPFEIEVREGGLLNYFNNVPIYEEYPSPLRTVGVLNGFMFSLFGLYDLLLLTKSEKAEKLFTSGIEALKKLLPYYDIGYWSRYYLFDFPKKYTASFTYQSLMAEQLKALYFITGEILFKDYSDKWLGYTKRIINKNRALIHKIIYARKISPKG